MSIGNRLFGYETAPGCLKNRLLSVDCKGCPWPAPNRFAPARLCACLQGETEKSKPRESPPRDGQASQTLTPPIRDRREEA